MKKNTYKFKTHIEFTSEHSYEPTTETESETVPGQSLSINEILIKFQQGTLPNISKNNPYYETDDDYDSNDPTEAPDFDLVDAENLLTKYQQKQKQKQKQLLDIKREKELEKQELSKNKTQKTEIKEQQNDKLNNETSD